MSSFRMCKGICCQTIQILHRHLYFLKLLFTYRIGKSFKSHNHKKFLVRKFPEQIKVFEKISFRLNTVKDQYFQSHLSIINR